MDDTEALKLRGSLNVMTFVGRHCEFGLGLDLLVLAIARKVVLILASRTVLRNTTFSLAMWNRAFRASP